MHLRCECCTRVLKFCVFKQLLQHSWQAGTVSEARNIQTSSSRVQEYRGAETAGAARALLAKYNVDYTV